MQQMISQIWFLALAELRRNYLNTKLGLFWALAQPAATFAVFWFVSVHGLKLGGSGDGPPYFAILFCGLLPWMTLSAAVSSALGSLRVQRHLLFDRAATSLVIVASNAQAAALMHLPLFCVVATIFLVAGITPTIMWVWCLYYYLCLWALSLAVCCFVAPLAARNADLGQAMTTVLLIWFWGSPIIWTPSILSAELLPYFRINPLFYVIEGYRSSLLGSGQIGEPVTAGLIFWAVTVAILVAGISLLRLSESHLREWLIK